MDNGWDNDSGPPAQLNEERVHRIPKKAIEKSVTYLPFRILTLPNTNSLTVSIKQDGPKVAIYHKASRHSPAVPLASNFSGEAIAVFSDLAAKQLRNGSKVVIFNGGDPRAIKDVLDWIMACVPEGKAVHFQTVSSEAALETFFPDLTHSMMTLSRTSSPSMPQQSKPRVTSVSQLVISLKDSPND
jgi:hypothetical protein